MQPNNKYACRSKKINGESCKGMAGQAVSALHIRRR